MSSGPPCHPWIPAAVLQIPDQPMILNRRVIHQIPPFPVVRPPCCAALLGLAPDGSAAAGDLSPPARRFHPGELQVEPVGKGAEPGNSSEPVLISSPLLSQTPPGNHLAGIANEMGDWTAIAAFGRDQQRHIRLAFCPRFT